MATISLGPNISSISGSVGRLTFSNWKGRYYVRRRAEVVANPQTISQSGMRSTLAEVSKLWYKVLTPPQRANWEEYAQNLGAMAMAENKSAGGQGLIKTPATLMSGFNAFIQAALHRQSIGYDVAGYVLADAPMGIVPPSPPLNLIAACNPTKNAIEISIDSPLEPGGDLVFPGPGGEDVHQPTLITIVAKPPGLYPRIVDLIPVSTPGQPIFECITDYPEYGELKPLYPGNWDIQAKATSGYGLVSPPTNLVSCLMQICCDMLDGAIEGAAYDVGDHCFDIDFLKTLVDGDCRADYVAVEVYNPDTEEWTHLAYVRAEWSDETTVYEVHIPFTSPAAGTWKFRLSAGSNCGKVGAWSAEEEVVIPA